MMAWLAQHPEAYVMIGTFVGLILILIGGLRR